MSSSEVYMIPCPIAENAMDTIPKQVVDVVHKLDHFIVERAKTARKYLKEINHPITLQDIVIEEIDKHDSVYAEQVLLDWIKKNKDFGIISEAGCPGIADPGARLISIAQRHKVKVIPLVGPTSIALALMASGMNGQQFSFHGYLPNPKSGLSKKLKDLEKNIQRNKSAEIFIETPYRNKALIKEIIKVCSPNLKLCIAVDITGANENIVTKTVKDWKMEKLDYVEKVPTIFVLGQ